MQELQRELSKVDRTARAVRQKYHTEMLVRAGAKPNVPPRGERLASEPAGSTTSHGHVRMGPLKAELAAAPPSPRQQWGAGSAAGSGSRRGSDAGAGAGGRTPQRLASLGSNAALRPSARPTSAPVPQVRPLFWPAVPAGCICLNLCLFVNQFG